VSCAAWLRQPEIQWGTGTAYGHSKFDLDVLRRQTNNFIERYLDNPEDKAVNAMSEIKTQPAQH
jgi:hypothetical protein